MRRAGPRGLLRRAGRLLGLVLALFVGVVLVSGWRAFGQRASGARRERMQASPHFRDGKFVNPQPLANDMWAAFAGIRNASPYTSPALPLPTAKVNPALFASPPPSGVRVTWFGHSSVLVEVDGYRVLTDPVWSERASPLTWLGPRRWYAPPLALSELPPLDAVVISHDHYDHLDYGTISAMKGWKVTFVVPLGVGAHLEYWGVPRERIVELDWWQRSKVRGLEIVCVPARHASGRVVLDDDTKLWAGYALLGPSHRAYYSGDTGLFPALREIGAQLGPFDVTLIEVGQYHSAWPDWHLGPEQAVTAHQLVRGRVLVPVHWGAFALAYHGWTEPIERVLAESAKRNVTTLVPMAGQSIEPSARPALAHWWPKLPWKAGSVDPIISTQMD